MKPSLSPASLSASLPPLAPGGRYALAYSGGLDSTVLLHLLRSAKLPLRAVHVHHGLRPEADAWAEHCREQCAALNVPFELRRVQVSRRDELGLEAAARAARYAALAETLAPADVLLTAQHQDDQAETVLLQLLRGAGPQGLAGMPALSLLGQARFARPLLAHTRAELRRYAEQYRLRWVEDPSNEEPTIKRSHLRQRLLPELERAWPGSSAALARGARLQAEASELLDELAQVDYARCAVASSPAVSVAALRALGPSRQRNLLRYWLAQQGLPAPASVHLEQALREVIGARADADPCLRWSGAELRRYRDGLYALASLPASPQATLRWNPPQTLRLPPGCGELRARRAAGKGLLLPSGSLPEVHFALGGERLKPVGDRHHRSLKQLCQAAGVPPWVRGRMPLIYVDGKLAAIADRWLAQDFAARRGQRGWLLEWRDPPPGWR